MNLNQFEYATKDLHFAAFLQLKGMIVKRLMRESNNAPIYFVFDDREICEHLEEVFWNGVGDEIMINAKDYFTTIRDLRARVFSITRERKLPRVNNYEGV